MDAAISSRLESGEKVTMANGKLLEKLLSIKMLQDLEVFLAERMSVTRDRDWDWDRYPEGPGRVL